ncbi:hypothetical protein [Sphingobium sp. YR768]|uniref:hypothetical protein n=1 Tax=Sphingobium sp. YR768 TaxID=1884365 RepID=UPI000B85676A|nr:hypothetical protein [Sphingobium sp. YR768]
MMSGHLAFANNISSIFKPATLALMTMLQQAGSPMTLVRSLIERVRHLAKAVRLLNVRHVAPEFWARATGLATQNHYA